MPNSPPSQSQQMKPAEVSRLVSDPEWWKKINPEDIRIRTGPILTEAEFKDLQRRKQAGNPHIITGKVTLNSKTK